MTPIDTSRTSIQRRLMVGFMLTTGAVLLLTSAAFFGTQYQRFRVEMVTNLTTLSRVIGSNAVAPLRFDDSVTAAETLAALQAEEHVMAAVVYDAAGRPFARYTRSDVDGFQPPLRPALGGRFTGATLELAEELVEDGEHLGTVFIRADTERLTEFIQVFGTIVVLVLAGASALSWLGARRLRAQIAEPLAELVQVAARLAQGDLSTQVHVDRDDETGALARAFNAMASSLRSLVGEVGRNTGSVMEAASALEESSRAMQSEAERQEQAVEGTAGSIELITASLRDVDANVESLSVTALETSSAAIEMSSSVGETSNHVERLSETIDTVASSVVQMTNAIQEIARSADALNSSTESTAGSLQELVASVAQVESNAHESHELSEKASGDAERGVESVRETLGGMKQIQDSFGDLNEVIGNLHEKSASIGEVVKVIQGVVEQTNLLALNAAIISAQAGTHGRAFGVVAEEVKSLADTTAASTREITQLIEAVQAGVADAVEAMGRGSKRVERGVALSNDAVAILQAIGESSHESTRRVREIVEAATAQARGLGRVDHEMKRVREVSVLVNRATHEQDSARSEITRGVEQMRTFSEHVQQAAQEQRRESRLISESIESVAQKVKEILSATKDQSKQAGQILEALKVFREVTLRSAKRVEETRRTVQDLSAQARSLDHEVGRFRL
jgi:methyl-accepting chemotaxis protein